jgi:hypothetical protein
MMKLKRVSIICVLMVDFLDEPETPPELAYIEYEDHATAVECVKNDVLTGAVRLSNSYTITKYLACGGSGVVFQAQSKEDRKLKVCHM